jgi:phage terminase small subunit
MRIFDVPVAPESFGDVATQRWREIWQSLNQQPSQSTLDIATMHCAAYAEFVEANRMISSTNIAWTRDERLIENPYIAIRDRAYAVMQQTEGELDLIGASRWDAIVENLLLSDNDLEDEGDAENDEEYLATGDNPMEIEDRSEKETNQSGG